MNLRKKLDWLDSTPRSRSNPRAERGDASERSGRDPSLELAAGGVAGSLDREHVLSDLRQRMAVLMQHDEPGEPASTTKAEPELSSLPFARYETALGPVFRRAERLGASAYFGRRDLEPAAQASSEMLALLALDPTLADRDVRGALYLDTETTGLGFGAGTVPFLVGMAYFDEDGQLWVEQLLLGSPDQERALMARVHECVERSSLLVSFNGKAYDLPLLGSRCVMTRQPSLPERPHLDLLHVSRRLHKSRLERFNLKHIEAQLLGFERDGDIDGSEVAPRYHHYLRTGDEEALRAVVDHNYLDVLSMVALVGIYAEPFVRLSGSDLVDLGETFRRGRALDQAQAAVEAALGDEETGEGYALRARLAKARGDKARALEDFEASLCRVDTPFVRLELAKLYEHFIKDARRALEVLDSADHLELTEPNVALAHRKARLKRKLSR